MELSLTIAGSLAGCKKFQQDTQRLKISLSSIEVEHKGEERDSQLLPVIVGEV
jgi:hypothetical protein